MSLEICPRCSNKLGAPLKSSGRQVCMRCAWSDQVKDHLSDRSSDSSASSAAHASELPGSVVTLSVLCHASVFLTPILAFPIVIPLVLYFGCQNSIIKANAKEALNFQVYTFIIFLLIFLAAIFAFFLLPIIVPILLVTVVGSVVLPIIAITQVLQSPSKIATYPWITRFF
jgi:uncharacterized protein